MPKYMKGYKVTFTVEGVPGKPITKTYHSWPGTTRKELKSRIVHEYGGRKVDIQEVQPSHS